MLRALVALLAILPVAAAGPMPAIYFLGGDGPTDPQLTSEAPESENDTLALVGPSISGPSLWFGGAGAVAEHLRGPVIIAVFPAGHVDGNLTAGIYVDSGNGPELIAEAGSPVQLDPSQAPDPVSLVPPDPTDPEGAILHALSRVMPAIYQAPIVYEIGPIDVPIPEGANVSIGFGMKGEGLLPAGAALLKYGSATAPSFAYVPWYSPDPVPAYSPPSGSAGSGWEPEESPAEPGAPTEPAPPSMQPTAPEEPADEDKGEDSPTVGVLIIGATLLAVALVLRRR